jgi:hypothetical protein
VTDEALLKMLMLRITEAVVHEVDERGHQQVPPQPVATPGAALEALNKGLPGRLPRLFEALLSTYRWPEADLDSVFFFANPPGADLSGFVDQVLQDRGLADSLLPARLVQFGRGPGGSYDPVCFDLHRSHAGDCPIVRVDHEEILCNCRIKVVGQLADTFRSLVTAIVTGPIGLPQS